VSAADLSLTAGPLRLVLRPAWGGRVLSLTHRDHGALLVPITATEFLPDAWPRGGAYPLVPFHTRVSEARFSFQGRDIALPPHPDTAPNALHGFASRRAWQGEADTDTAHLDLRHPGDSAWPWRLRARQAFRLAPDRLEIALSVTNDDALPMPAGLGWHPYFPPVAALHTDARHFWPVRPDLTPTGERRDASEQTGDTRYLSDWRRCGLTLASGARLTLTASADLTHLVAYQAPAGYLCLEPVSHLANALAEPPAEPRDAMRPLAPGETLSATVTLTLAA
jgi:aldose 1-epimerase